MPPSSAISRPGSRSTARRATTAGRRRGSCWCRRSRTSGWPRLVHVDVDARNRELARYTEAMRSRGGPARRPVRRRVHADADGDGRLAGAADDQRHPPERDRRSGVRRDADDGARLRAGPVRHLGDGIKAFDDAARAGARQEPALVLSLPAAERRVRRRPARQPVRLGQLPRRDEAARRADHRAGPADLAPGPDHREGTRRDDARARGGGGAPRR